MYLYWHPEFGLIALNTGCGKMTFKPKCHQMKAITLDTRKEKRKYKMVYKIFVCLYTKSVLTFPSSTCDSLLLESIICTVVDPIAK